MADDFWTIEDFGFTAVNESELEVAKAASTASSSAKQQEEKLKKLYNAIKPLLANLKQNPDKIDWDELSENPNAIHILEQNHDKIDWSYFSINPNIFEYDNPDSGL